MDKICPICKKSFRFPPSRAKKINYCSKDCWYFTKKGVAFFDSTGISSWNKGTKGLTVPWNKGKTNVYSEGTIKKMREAGLKTHGDKHPQWTGGIRIHNGYRHIFCPNHPLATKNKTVSEHRLVMEQYLGRFLRKEEVVHHINGDKLDNKIENLKLFDNNRDHLLFHSATGTIHGRPKKLKDLEF